LPYSHGVDPRNTSPAAKKRVATQAALEKRRLSRRYGVKWSDLDTVGRLRFDAYVEICSVTALAKKWMDENQDKLISKDGKTPQIWEIFLRSDSNRLRSLDKLEEYIRTELKSPEQELREVLESNGR
jgi:hypothetical protein